MSKKIRYYSQNAASATIIALTVGGSVFGQSALASLDFPPPLSKNSIGYSIYIHQKVGDKDTIPALQPGLRSYEDPNTPFIPGQAWTHTSKWLHYQLDEPATVTFEASPNENKPNNPYNVPAFTIWSGDVIDHTSSPMDFSELHAYMPNPKQAKRTSNFDPATWPRDSEGNFIFFPLYVADSIANIGDIPPAEWEKHRTELEWIGTVPNDPANPADTIQKTFDLPAGVYTINLSNHFNPDSNDSGVALMDFSITAAPPVPIPAAAWLFGSALLGLLGFRRRKA